MPYGGDLSEPTDVVRYLIQDTDPDEPLFADNEVAYELAQAADVPATAALSLAVRLMHRYARMVTTADGELKVELSDLYDNAKDLVSFLSTSPVGSAAASAVPYAGGISQGDVDARNADTDRVPNLFSRETGAPRAWPPAAWWGR